MSSVQKVIKIFAIILAIFIIINICSAIIGGIALFGGMMYSVHHEEDTSMSSEKIQEEQIDKIENLHKDISLDIELTTSNLEIKKGERFQVEKINMTDDLKCRLVGNTLKVEEKEQGFFNKKNSNATLLITIPEDKTLHKMDIEMGIGKMQITDIKTAELDIDAGMGITTLENVVAQKANIDGGAGNFTITNGILENLDLDCGVGVTRIVGDVKGNSKISCGVGKTELHLSQVQENYRISTQIGLGGITLNGNKCNNSVYGSGDDYIRIDGGVGNVEITTK